MKLVTYYSGNNKIELFNSIWGKETIKVNEETVSSHFSAFGSVHQFTIKENEQDVPFSARIRMGYGYAFDIFRNGEPVLESAKNGAWRLFFHIFILVIILKILENGFNLAII